VVAEIRGALDGYGREQLQEILAYVFRGVRRRGRGAGAGRAAMLGRAHGARGAVVRRVGDLAAAAPRCCRSCAARGGQRARARARGRTAPFRSSRRANARAHADRGAGSASRAAVQPACTDGERGADARGTRPRRRRSRPAPQPAPPSGPAPAPQPSAAQPASEQKSDDGHRRQTGLLLARGRLMSAPVARRYFTRGKEAAARRRPRRRHAIVRRRPSSWRPT